MRLLLLVCLGLHAGSALASDAIPANLVVDGIPPIPPALKADTGRYLEFRTAAFQSWHPVHRELVVLTRFGDSAQAHRVRAPGGARHQLTFQPEPVRGASFRPGIGDCLLLTQDRGGGEFYQLYRFDLADGRMTLLTDGASRNTNPRWARSGQWLAYSSTRRNGRDTDIHVIDPSNPGSDRRLIENVGGGWSVTDWSPDEKRLLLVEYLSINESRLHLLDVSTGTTRRVSSETGTQVAYSRALFNHEGSAVFTISDRDSEFGRLVRLDLATGRETVLTADLDWGVEDLSLSPDGRTVAFVVNEEGASRLYFHDVRSGKRPAARGLPDGVIAGIEWHPAGRELAFTLSSARSPADTWSYDPRRHRLTRWTESEIGGLDPRTFPEPELIRFASFDGREIPAFVYRPDSRRFPGPRPTVVSIHGGPESQSRPIFQARNNYLINELGVALVVPNVRGSTGYGKSFVQLDNGFRREDSVRDIGALLDWIGRDPGLDSGRVAVMGGSYGGYMVLASLIHFGERLRGGIDVVGISNFLTFLANTQDYRRDLRRAEYGDERDPAMREFLERISPTRNVGRIRRPLLVVQGENDP
ncbi:MAG: S9 family peptidase, partial [Limisphaerales bacterium]